CLAVRESLIGRPADGLAEDDPAIDHDDERALILHRASVQTYVKVENIDAILAVGGEIVLEAHAAARARGQGIVAVLVGRDGVLHVRNARIGTADREVRNSSGSGDVLVEERGGHAQSYRHVVKAVDPDILGQDVLCVHVHTHQSFYGGGVLGTIEALDRHMARLRTFGVGGEGVLHPVYEGIDIPLRRLGGAGGRHQVAAELAESLLPDLRVVGGALEVEGVECDAAGFQARVVAGDTVGGQHRAVWIGRGGGLGGG